MAARWSYARARNVAAAGAWPRLVAIQLVAGLCEDVLYFRPAFEDAWTIAEQKPEGQEAVQPSWDLAAALVISGTSLAGGQTLPLNCQ